MKEDYTVRAQELVRAEIFKKFQPLWVEEGEAPVEPPQYKTRIIWACKTLRNWKVIISSDLPDRIMYEITYDGEKKRTYIDTYDKIDQTIIDDEGLFDLPVSESEKIDRQEADRNARAYGWEIGHGHPLVKTIIDASPDNPFMNPNWQSTIPDGG